MYIRFFKVIFDVFWSLVLLAVLFPLLLFVYLILLMIHKSNPIFYQKRVGQFGENFTILKFKTIKADSSSNLFLKFLRKTKIDELPQLVNVIKCEMSLVGPRPDLPGYYDQLQGGNRSILDLKPGITGYASIEFANEEEILSQQENPLEYNDQVIFPEKVKLNLKYRNNISFGLDIKILIKTLLLPFK
ncbi:sugar transferase [Psychroflexus aestuariivivens]|uniref:sugar transferase n=1 Tax=Psychroflexus aestuariivivens TaxID=1795040 RepID=UPI000FD886DD|nr:sugar transferase [Psychroflexus aestuariivivens]